MNLENIISTFLETHKIKPQQETARSFIFDCPSCGGKKKLYIQKRDGSSVCFKQGNPGMCPRPGTHAPYALSLISGLPYNQVKQFLNGNEVTISDDIDVDFDESKNNNKINKELAPIGFDKFPHDISYIGSESFIDGKNYLNSRGITDDMIKKYDIGYSPSMRRVIFWVRRGDKTYGWQGRAIDKVDKEYRMYNLPGEWKSKTLMFENNIINSDFAILAEGAVSALKFELCGNFVASMGKEVSKNQLNRLKELGIKKLYLALDRDAFAKNEQIRYTLSSEGIECFKIEVPPHRDDFGDSTCKECLQAFQSAKKLEDSLSTGDWDIIIEDKNVIKKL